MTTAEKVKASEAGTVKMLAKEWMVGFRATFTTASLQSSLHSLVHVNMSSEIEM